LAGARADEKAEEIKQILVQDLNYNAEDFVNRLRSNAQKLAAGKNLVDMSKNQVGKVFDKNQPISARIRERKDHYTGGTKTSRGWASAPDEDTIFFLQLREDTVNKNQTPARFHGFEGYVNINIMPGQLVS
jgi:hypothetical protein